MNVARLGNKYLADEEPWKVINPERVQTNVCSLQIAAALSSFMNRSCLYC
jgi:methionyl-tRNA synthetase